MLTLTHSARNGGETRTDGNWVRPAMLLVLLLAGTLTMGTGLAERASPVVGGPCANSLNSSDGTEYRRLSVDGQTGTDGPVTIPAGEVTRLAVDQRKLQWAGFTPNAEFVVWNHDVESYVTNVTANGTTVIGELWMPANATAGHYNVTVIENGSDYTVEDAVCVSVPNGTENETDEETGAGNEPTGENGTSNRTAVGGNSTTGTGTADGNSTTETGMGDPTVIGRGRGPEIDPNPPAWTGTDTGTDDGPDIVGGGRDEGTASGRPKTGPTTGDTGTGDGDSGTQGSDTETAGASNEDTSDSEMESDSTTETTPAQSGGSSGDGSLVDELSNRIGSFFATLLAWLGLSTALGTALSLAGSLTGIGWSIYGLFNWDNLDPIGKGTTVGGLLLSVGALIVGLTVGSLAALPLAIGAAVCGLIGFLNSYGDDILEGFEGMGEWAWKHIERAGEEYAQEFRQWRRSAQEFGEDMQKGADAIADGKGADKDLERSGDEAEQAMDHAANGEIGEAFEDGVDAMGDAGSGVAKKVSNGLRAAGQAASKYLPSW